MLLSSERADVLALAKDIKTFSPNAKIIFEFADNYTTQNVMDYIVFNNLHTLFIDDFASLDYGQINKSEAVVFELKYSSQKKRVQQ